MSNKLHKILLDRSSLLEILRTAQHLLDKKNEQDISILEIILQGTDSIELRISDGSIMLCGQIKADVQNISEELPKTVKVNPYDLYERIRKIDSMNIIIFADDKNLTIQYREIEKQCEFEYFDQGSFTLDQLKNNFKSIVPEGVHSTFRINHQNLINYLKILKLAVAVEDIREQFRGISVIVEPKKIILWSTDGIKMSFAEINDVHNEQSISGIWPRKFTDALCSINQDNEAVVKIYPKQVEYIVKNLTMISPLINAKLLNYENILNFRDAEYSQIIVDAGYFTKKLERILVVTKNEGSALFDLSENSTLVGIKNNRTEKAEVELKFIQWNGIGAKIHINPFILANFTRTFKGNIEIKIYKKSGNIIINKEGQIYPLFLTKLMIPNHREP